MANSSLPPSSLLLILLFAFFSNAFNLPSAMDCNSSDRAALLKIKEQLGNPPELSSWLPATNCCAWDNSIICSETGRVYLVALFRLNVTAPIPSAYGDLPMLQTIQLDTMPGLYGPIPSSFAKLSHLELLDITGTQVSGPIPDFLVKTNLSALTITNSKLTGPIPQYLSRLSNLRYIDLSSNMLSGTIPPGLLHGSYRFLILSNNLLTGQIPEDYAYGDIDTIDLSHNQLTCDPSFLFGIAKPMTKIDLSWNELAFDMTKVRFPYHLTYLDLSHNHIKGGVSKFLKDIKLGHFNVSYNDLCGEIPTGRFMVYHGADSYVHNKCLCGTPLPPHPIGGGRGTGGPVVVSARGGGGKVEPPRSSCPRCYSPVARPPTAEGCQCHLPPRRHTGSNARENPRCLQGWQSEDTTNGVRIKMWPGSPPSRASNITFEDINMQRGSGR